MGNIPESGYNSGPATGNEVVSFDEAMGKSSGGNALGAPESAAAYVGGSGAGTPRHEESYGDRVARSEAEEARLIQWAADYGKLGGKIPAAQDRGGEHTVSYDPKSNRYFKATRPDANLGYGIALTDSGLGASPSEYLAVLCPITGISEMTCESNAL